MDRLTRRGTYNGLDGFWVKEINGTESFVSWENDCYEGIAKLAHYEDLAEAGRLVELPCKVGDTLYGTDQNYRVIGFTDKGIFVQPEMYNWVHHANFPFECIGKTVFVNREDAESRIAELEQMEKGGGSNE